MPERDDYRTVSRELSPGHHIIAIVATGGEADTKSDDEIIAALQNWKRDHRHLQPVDTPPDRERWPMPQPFGEWLMATKPGPKGPCPECGCYGLRLAPVPNKPGEEKVICTMSECEACPWYQEP
ncbi:hypothetical protein ABZX74_15475 [Streptomyces olivaceoviridis]|uniref:hypothetical protein n=1 Tax=Streptomyces olivaceoviridis TaxID=1921 RepID=UPI0033B4036F